MVHLSLGLHLSSLSRCAGLRCPLQTADHLAAPRLQCSTGPRASPPPPVSILPKRKKKSSRENVTLVIDQISVGSFVQVFFSFFFFFLQQYYFWLRCFLLNLSRVFAAGVFNLLSVAAVVGPQRAGESV